MFQIKKEYANNETEENVEITTHKKRHISPEKTQQIIDELKLVPKNYCWMHVKTMVALQRIKTEYQKIANLLHNTSNNHLNLGQEIG